MQAAADGFVVRARSILVDLRAAESADLAALIFVAKRAALLSELTVTDVHDHRSWTSNDRIGRLFERIVVANWRTLARAKVPDSSFRREIAAASAQCPNLREWTSRFGSYVEAVARNCTALERLRLWTDTSDELSQFRCYASLTDLDFHATPSAITHLSAFASITALRCTLSSEQPLDLDAFSATVAPLGLLRSLHLVRVVIDDEPGLRGKICGTLRVPSLRILTQGVLCGLDTDFPAARVACPALEEWASEDGSIALALPVVRVAPRLRSIVCGGTSAAATVGACFGMMRESFPMRNVERLAMPRTVLSAKALEYIGAFLTKLTHIEFRIADHAALASFCLAVAGRMVELRVHSKDSGGFSSPRHPDVVMATLRTLDISDMLPREAAFLQLPALTTLYAAGGRHTRELLGRCPRLEHCSIVDTRGSWCPAATDPSEARVECPLVTQLFVGAYYMPIAEIEHLLAVFPGVSWLSVYRPCSDECALDRATGRDAEVCEHRFDDDDDDENSPYRLTDGCREQILRRATRLMPHLRELFVGAHKNMLSNHGTHVSVSRLRELGLAESMPQYRDELEGSTALQIHDRRHPWD